MSRRGKPEISTEARRDALRHALEAFKEDEALLRAALMAEARRGEIVAAHQRALDGFHRAFEKASGNIRVNLLLATIDYCGRSGVLVPTWAATAFAAAWSKWASLEVGTLDDAFGAAPVKHHRARRNRSDALIALMHELARRRDQGLALDWREIADTLGWGHTLLEAIYRDTPTLRELYPTKRKKRG